MSGTWGAGLTGPDGTDYVAEQADALREKMGKGLYSRDQHGTMGQWRDFVAIPLALFRNFIDWIIANGNPGTADGLLEHWETILGLGLHAAPMWGPRAKSELISGIPAWIWWTPKQMGVTIAVTLGGAGPVTVSAVGTAVTAEVMAGGSTIAGVKAAIAATPAVDALLGAAGTDGDGFGTDYLGHGPLLLEGEINSIADRQQRCKERLRRWTATPADPAGRPAWAGFPTDWSLWTRFWAIQYRALGVSRAVATFYSSGPCEWTLEYHPDLDLPGNARALAELTFLRDVLCPAWGQILLVTGVP